MAADAHEPAAPGVWVQDLHHSHPGVTCAVSEALCEAASVCLDRHHESPKEFSLDCDGDTSKLSLYWQQSSAYAKAAHGYEHDATKEGAYALSLLCVENHLGLVAAGQAAGGTGADWYITRPENVQIDADGFPNLDVPEIYRLEVSGVNRGPIGGRLTKKTEQLDKPESEIPGIAAVVGFERAAVRIKRAGNAGGSL